MLTVTPGGPEPPNVSAKVIWTSVPLNKYSKESFRNAFAIFTKLGIFCFRLFLIETGIVHESQNLAGAPHKSIFLNIDSCITQNAYSCRLFTQ